MARTVNLGQGRVVPYPEPSSPEASAIGRANRRADTKPEVDLRRGLHAMGLRIRKDLLLRAGTTRTRADIVFKTVRLAVFVDGCFWHVCPEHFHMPKTNLTYWEPKLAANVERDARVVEALEAHGWSVLRLWEHVSPGEAAQEVVLELARLRHERGSAIAEGLPPVAPPP